MERCYDTNYSRKKTDYDCHGDFTPDGGTTDDAYYKWAYAIVVAIPVGVLSWIVMVSEPTP